MPIPTIHGDRDALIAALQQAPAGPVIKSSVGNILVLDQRGVIVGCVDVHAGTYEPYADFGIEVRKSLDVGVLATAILNATPLRHVGGIGEPAEWAVAVAAEYARLSGWSSFEGEDENVKRRYAGDR